MSSTPQTLAGPTQFLVDGFMLAVLDAVKKELPKLLRDEDDWNGMHIDYETPHVDRLWRPWGEYRVHLHHIHPCGGAAPFWHPHRTPSAMEVVEGTYRMRQGRGPGTEPPRISSQVLLVPGCQYEMTDVDAWHSVQPERGPVLSIMVTAPPWQPLREMPKLPQARQKPLAGRGALAPPALFPAPLPQLRDEVVGARQRTCAPGPNLETWAAILLMAVTLLVALPVHLGLLP